jgi:hypothetical protein
MKVIMGDRTLIYKLLSAAYRSVGISPAIAEIGVLDGLNAKRIDDILEPRYLTLIDAWSAFPIINGSIPNAGRPWIEPLSAYSNYYGGALDDQVTYDRLYESALEKFKGRSNVEFIRADRLEALSQLRRSAQQFDMIYVDANHQYEAVFDDLMFYEGVLAEDGFFQLNDCCHSDSGIRQNLGVLEATVKFCKMKQYEPILLANTDWTDVLIARRTNAYTSVIDKVIMSNSVQFVEIPSQLLGALNVRVGSLCNLSFV